ncbi:hypothetical protein Tco_1077959, partial [Tanacetum coccineum]
VPDISLKDKNEAKPDKTEHEFEKSAKNRGQRVGIREGRVLSSPQPFSSSIELGPCRVLLAVGALHALQGQATLACYFIPKAASKRDMANVACCCGSDVCMKKKAT